MPNWILNVPSVEETWSPCLHTLEGPDVVTFSVAWSPDESGRVATSGNPPCVHIWDSNTGRLLANLKGHTEYLRTVAWSPDGSGRLASGSFDKTIKIWDSAHGQCIFTLRGHNQAVRSVSWSEDGRRVASASQDKTIKIWDTVTGLCISTIDCPDVDVFSVAWSPGEIDRLASTGDGRHAHIFKPASGECIFSLSGFDKSISSIAWSPDGTMLGVALENCTIEVWKMNTDHGERLFVFNWRKIRDYEYPERDEYTASDLSPPSCAISWSKDGKRLASSGDDKTLTVWDITDGNRLFTLEGHFDRVVSVTWSPDGTRLASSSLDKTVKIWDLTSGQDYFVSGDARSIELTAWSPDRQKLACVSKGKRINIWDSTDGQCMVTLEADMHDFRIEAVQWSPDGRHISSGSNEGTVDVWDVSTGEYKSKLTFRDTHTDGADELFIVSHHWSPNGKELATASSNDTIHIWNPDSGELLFYLGMHPRLRLMTWSPDGRRLASTAFYGEVSIWDVADRQCKTLKPNGDDCRPFFISWSASGNQIVCYFSGFSSHSIIRVWDLTTGKSTFTCCGLTPQTRFIRFSDANPNHLHTSWGILDTSDPDLNLARPRFLPHPPDRVYTPSVKMIVGSNTTGKIFFGCLRNIDLNIHHRWQFQDQVWQWFVDQSVLLFSNSLKIIH